MLLFFFLLMVPLEVKIIITKIMMKFCLKHWKVMLFTIQRDPSFLVHICEVFEINNKIHVWFIMIRLLPLYVFSGSGKCNQNVPTTY